jgi:hypothetical protein
MRFTSSSSIICRKGDTCHVILKFMVGGYMVRKPLLIVKFGPYRLILIDFQLLCTSATEEWLQTTITNICAPKCMLQMMYNVVHKGYVKNMSPTKFVQLPHPGIRILKETVCVCSTILYIQRLPQHSPDSAVTGPVEIGPIPMRTTATTKQ